MSGDNIGALVGLVCPANLFGSTRAAIIIVAYITLNVSAMSDSVFRVACFCWAVNGVSLR